MPHKHADSIPENSAEGRLVKSFFELTGVKLTQNKSHMIRSRLQRRMGELNLKTIEDYERYFNRHLEAEKEELISLLTTHHTFFFREKGHFVYLFKEHLCEIVKKIRSQGRKKIKIWSAACSKGQEPYSIAMALEYHLPKVAPDFDYEILASDVDKKSVEIANNGVYERIELKNVPSDYLKGACIHGTGDIVNFTKISQPLKNKIKFKTINLQNFKLDEKFDIVFCRNVFIYFSQEQISTIANNLSSHLYSEGFLVIGNSESFYHIQTHLKLVGPSIYTQNSTPHFTESPKKSFQPSVTPQTKKLISILCVDDSPTILKLYKSIFSQANGFSILDTIESPKKALDQILKLKPDVVTLDVHMPEMNGTELLKELRQKSNIPVVMISSLRKEESTAYLESLKLGAFDYLEKPSLENLSSIKTVLIETVQSAANSRSIGNVLPIKIHKINESPLRLDPILIGSSTGGTEALKSILIALPNEIPPILIVQHIPAGFSEAFAKLLNTLCFFTVAEAKDRQPVIPNQVLIAPGNFHMKLEKSRGGLVVRTHQSEPVNRHRPSVDVLFDSAIDTLKNKATAFILTGMGSDGAKGLLKIKQAGGQTFAQSEKTCVVYGMPRAAVELGAHNEIIDLNEIPKKIRKLFYLPNQKKYSAA